MKQSLLFSLLCCIAINLCYAQPNRFADIPKDTLNVIVVNEEREPVEGATIRLYGLRSISSPGSHFGVREYETFTTNAEGEAAINYPRYVYEEYPTSELTLEINHPNYAKTNVDNIKLNGSSNPIVLDRGTTVNLNVKLGDIIIKNCTATIGYEPFQMKDGNPIHGILPKVHSFYVSYQDQEGNIYYSDVTTLDATTKNEIHMELELYKGLTLNGMISEDVPRPIKNGNVIVNMINEYRHGPNGRNESMVSVPREFHSAVNEDGSFTIKNLPKGLGQVISICDAFVSARVKNENSYNRCQSFHLAVDGQEIDVAMEPGASITGTVTDQDGNPIEGVMVACSPNVFWGNGFSTLFMRTYSNYMITTEKDGRYKIEQIPADENVRFSAFHQDYEMIVDQQDNQSIFIRQSVTLKPGELISIDFKMKKKE